MAYNIFIDNAISYGYIKSNKFDAPTLSSDDLLSMPITKHSDNSKCARYGQNQTHIVADVLRNLSAIINEDAHKYGAMFIKIDNGNFNLSNFSDSDEDNYGNWELFVNHLDDNSSSSTKFTRIYRKNGDVYERVTKNDVSTLKDDDEQTTDALNNEYVLVYGYKFIRDYGRNAIKVPMMPNLYSVFTSDNVHVRVNNGNPNWNSTDNELTDKDDIFVSGKDVHSPKNYYGEFKAQVDLDGWITKTLSVNNRILTRKKWSTSDNYTTAQTDGKVGPYSILGKDNDNELYIWFDEVSGNIYLGTLENATFEGAIPSDDGEYITADGGHASVIVKPNPYYTFDVDSVRNGIRFDTEKDGDTPTIESVTRDEDGKVTITLNGVIDEILDDKPKIIVPEPRQTKLNISVVYHKFDPFAGGNGNQQPIDADVIDTQDFIFKEGGYYESELGSVSVTPPETLTDIVDDDGVSHNYVYFGLSKFDVVTDGSEIVDTAIFNVADDENKALIAVKDNSVVYHLYYVDVLDLYAEVTLTNVHEYTQAGPTDESGKYLNDGNLENLSE